jgi:Tfp pilus assembly protein PilN
MSQQINLFNPMFRKRGFSWTSADAMLYGVGIAFVLSGLCVAYNNFRLSSVQREAQAVEQEYQAVTTQRDALVAAQSQRQSDTQLSGEISRLEGQLTMRQQIIGTLQSGAVGTTTGFSEYMRAFSRQTIGGLWLTGFDIATEGDQLALHGRTLSPDLLPHYLQRLNQEQVMHGRQFAALAIQRPAAATPAAPAPTSAESLVAAAAPANATTSVPATAEPITSTPRYLEFTISTSDSAPVATEPAR